MQYLQIFLYVVIVHILAACGGGESSSQDELAFSDDDFDQYTGVTTGANLDASQMDLFVSIVLSNSYEFPSDYSNSNFASKTFSTAAFGKMSTAQSSVSASNTSSIKVNETEECVNGGNRTIKGTVNADFTGVLEIQYSLCREGYTTYNGNVSIKIVDGSDSNYEAISYFKKLQITYGNSQTRLSGSQHIIESNYGATVEMVSDLVQVDQDTKAQIKFENYKTKSSCINCTYAADSTFEGRIYHSDFGYLDVLTDEPLNDGGSYSSNGLVGQLRFLSSSGQTFILTYEYDNVYKQSTINHKVYSVRVQLDGDSDGQFENEVVIPFELAFLFEVYDIADTDGDTMTDGWERLFGLNPTLNDAEIDLDSDGYSNLVEFLYGGNPLSNTEVPLVTDLSVVLSESYENVRAGRPQTILVTIDNPNIVYGAQEVSITLTKSSNTEWGEHGLYGWTILNDQQISRTIDNIRNDSQRAVSIEIMGEPGEYTLSASVTSKTEDTNQANNENTLSASFDPRETNIGLIANSAFTQSSFSIYDAAAVDYEHSFRILVTHGGPDDAKNTEFRMSLPEHIDVLSASYLVNNVSSGDCTVAEEIHCSMGTIFHNGASFKGHVQIDVKGVSEGIGDYSARITSDSLDPEPEDNQITKQIFVGQSLQSIQDQIDAADEPLEINLAAGMYVGGLNLSNKSVTINGNEGPEETIVRTVSPVSTLRELFNVGSSSTIRNIRFAGREARTYSTPAMHLSGENIAIENNIFEHHGNNVVGIDGWAQNVNISRNTFRNSKTSPNSLCHIIGVDGPGPYRIENNLIYDTDCNAIVMFKSFNSPGQSSFSTIINNTLINNVAGISDLVMYESSNFKIANNIIVDNQVGLSIEQGNAGLFNDPYWLPVISNNLFYGNQEDLSISQYLDMEYIENGSNLYIDPLFVDQSSNNFELSAGSSAIDAGSDLDAPSYDLNNNYRPQDGNGDGLSQVDIGAFERNE